MNAKEKAFRIITEKAGFDINAGQNIDSSKTLQEMINYIVKYIDEGNKGCCFHASVYLMKLLHDANIDSEIIITFEPTILDNGKTRNDMRASVLVKDGDKYIVMNPIEDIEFFEKENIPLAARKKYYEENSTVLIGEKNGISSPNAAQIDLEDFIARYGDGKAWTLGSLYCNGYETIKFGEIMSNAKVINIDEYIPSNPIKK